MQNKKNSEVEWSEVEEWSKWEVKKGRSSGLCVISVELDRSRRKTAPEIEILKKKQFVIVIESHRIESADILK